jgi:hypothetical protein
MNIINAILIPHDCLQIYAGSFFAIPLFRWLLLRKTNNDIARRNKAREERAQELVSPEPSLRRKVTIKSV